MEKKTVIILHKTGSVDAVVDPSHLRLRFPFIKHSDGPVPAKMKTNCACFSAAQEALGDTYFVLPLLGVDWSAVTTVQDPSGRRGRPCLSRSLAFSQEKRGISPSGWGHSLQAKGHTMQENACSGESQMESVSDSSESPEACPLTCMEPFTVRRLSCRSVQLPPLAFRQAEQYYCEKRPETETAQPRPTSLPLRTPPLIAITSAESSR
ncbi:hypothetical protein SRHO_G00324390 [Serrasalmus rhombeus]